MLFLLLGPDDFSKKEYIVSLAQKTNNIFESFSEVENISSVENLASQDLFSKHKTFVLRGLIAKFNEPEIINKFIASKNNIIIVEDKVDKRIKSNKDLLVRKDIEVKEFALPHGKELDKWITSHVKSLGGFINHQAVNYLAEGLGRDDAKETKVAGKVVAVEEVYNLWQADGEVKKLIALAEGREITELDVKELISASREVDVFTLTNAIADNKKHQALSLMQDFLALQTGTDEKGAVIKLNAILGEQFRNVAAVQSFLADKRQEAKILEATGWKSGRLFVIKKIATRFKPQTVLDFLNKLAALDFELKTSSTPPRVLLDLILAQLF